MAIERLNVHLNIGPKQWEVGELVLSKRGTAFKFLPSYLDAGLDLSPIKLPLKEGIQVADHRLFEGVHGLFADSLPDSWGRLLLDRHLQLKGQPITGITALDRLAYVGNTGMGALSYSPSMKDPNAIEKQLELDQVAAEMNEIIEGAPSDIIDELYQLGGSSGGARPKIHLGYNQQDQNFNYGQQELPEGFEHWIIKFPSRHDRPDIAHIEYAYYLMALSAGLSMNTCELITGNSGKSYFGTKRFDRIGNERLHMHSASGLMHDDYQYSQIDYGHLMDAAFQLEGHVNAYEKILRIAAFNLYAHNRDDHSRNFAFLMDERGKWQVAPAYDLTFSSSSHGMHSTTFASEGKYPGKAHLLELADIFSVKNAALILEEVKEAVNQWTRFAKQAGVEKPSTQLIQKTTQTLLKN